MESSLTSLFLTSFIQFHFTSPSELLPWLDPPPEPLQWPPQWAPCFPLGSLKSVAQRNFIKIRVRSSPSAQGPPRALISFRLKAEVLTVAHKTLHNLAHLPVLALAPSNPTGLLDDPGTQQAQSYSWLHLLSHLLHISTQMSPSQRGLPYHLILKLYTHHTLQTLFLFPFSS